MSLPRRFVKWQSGSAAFMPVRHPLRSDINCVPGTRRNLQMSISRRDFIHSTLAAATLSASANTSAANLLHANNESSTANQNSVGNAKLPVIVCAANGFKYLDDAYSFLAAGGDTLDAALKVV